ncbi:hypothetical protein ABPG72_003530 [Tetrahymena utriculariae]
MVDTIDLHEDLKSIVKEGWLEKESKFLRSWRKRWFVLTNSTLYTFKESKVYKNPTEVIPLKSVTTIKSAEDETNKLHSFKLEVGERKFYMVASANNEKEQWIGAIGKQMVKLIQRGKPSFSDEDD